MSEQDEDLNHADPKEFIGENNRRRHQRRTGHDRRDTIRFEPEKDNRRDGNDRRDGRKEQWEFDSD